MHKYIILFFSVSVFLCSCKSDSVPDDIIQPDQMSGLLTQIHLIDGSLYFGVQTQDSLYKYGMGKYLAAFKMYHTDSATFRKSMTYYAEESGKLLAIYEKVDTRMKVISDSINAVVNKDRLKNHKADSLRADSMQKANKKGLAIAKKRDSLEIATARQKLQLKLDSINNARKLKKPGQKKEFLGPAAMRKRMKMRVDSIQKVKKLKFKGVHALPQK